MHCLSSFACHVNEYDHSPKASKFVVLSQNFNIWGDYKTNLIFFVVLCMTNYDLFDIFELTLFIRLEMYKRNEIFLNL